MSDKEKAAEGWVDRYGIPEWLKTDTDEDRKRYSCDGCDQSLSSIREAFLAGAEWAEKQPKWIKCSERLPEVSGEYLASRFKGDRGWSLDYSAEFKGWNLGFNGERENEMFPSHWQPLPEAPKEEES